MINTRKAATAALTALACAFAAASAGAKDAVKVGFIGPLTGGCKAAQRRCKDQI